MTQAESAWFVESFLRDVGDITDVDVVIIPPFTAIAKVSEALGRAQNIKVGAQNMYWEKSGPYTGEISAPLLRDLFVHYVVLGHSERRTLFGETDEMVNRKVRAAHEAALRPIVCVGETLDQRERGSVEKILGLQLRGSLAHLGAKELKTIQLLIPPRALLTELNRVFAPLGKQIVTLKLQARALRTARDLLLPRLMSGEIAV